MLSHCMPRSYLYHHGILIRIYQSIYLFIIHLLRINIDVLFKDHVKSVFVYILQLSATVEKYD